MKAAWPAITEPLLWERHTGTCLVSDGHVHDLVGKRDAVEERLRQFEDRLPLLAYGANVSPERLAVKLAHLPEGHRSALILAGWIDDFDVGANARDLVWAAYEDPAAFFATHFDAMRSASRPFESPHWEEMPLDQR